LDEVPLPGFFCRTTAIDYSSFFLADFDVIQNTFHGLVVDDRAHGFVFHGIAHGDLIDALLEALQEHVVNLLVDDDAGAGRALLSLKTKRRLGYAFDCSIKIRVGVDDDGVLAAHLQDRALDPFLTGALDSRTLVDIEPNFFRPGESYETGQWMLDQSRAEARSRTRAEVHNAIRHPRFLKGFEKFGGDCRRIVGRLNYYCVPADDRGHGHARHDGARKVPRRNHRAHAQRNVNQAVVFSRQLDRGFGVGEAQRFARVELREIDGLGDVAIGLRPVFSPFVDHPGSKLELALARHTADGVQQRSAFFRGSVLPALECRRGCLDRGLHVLTSRALEYTDHLRRSRRVERLDLLVGLDQPAADHRVILPARLSAHLTQRFAHTARIFRIAKVRERLVSERAGGNFPFWLPRSQGPGFPCDSFLSRRCVR